MRRTDRVGKPDLGSVPVVRCGPRDLWGVVVDHTPDAGDLGPASLVGYAYAS
jgi:hypothetical protein